MKRSKFIRLIIATRTVITIIYVYLRPRPTLGAVQPRGLKGVQALYGVLVKECNLRPHNSNMETILYTIDPYYGNLN